MADAQLRGNPAVYRHDAAVLNVKTETRERHDYALLAAREAVTVARVVRAMLILECDAGDRFRVVESATMLEVEPSGDVVSMMGKERDAAPCIALDDRPKHRVPRCQLPRPHRDIIRAESRLFKDFCPRPVCRRARA